MKLKMFCFSAACELLLQPFVARPKTNVYKFAREAWPTAAGGFAFALEYAVVIRIGVDSSDAKL
jgi:hypothetical protein